MFHNIHDIINHKKHYCKLRFACKCASSSAASKSGPAAVNGTPASPLRQPPLGGPAGTDKCDIALLCNTCNQAFSNPWDLMVHAQTTHAMAIFEQEEEEDVDQGETSCSVGMATVTAPSLPVS